MAILGSVDVDGRERVSEGTEGEMVFLGKWFVDHEAFGPAV